MVRKDFVCYSSSVRGVLEEYGVRYLKALVRERSRVYADVYYLGAYTGFAGLYVSRYSGRRCGIIVRDGVVSGYIIDYRGNNSYHVELMSIVNKEIVKGTIEKVVKSWDDEHRYYALVISTGKDYVLVIYDVFGRKMNIYPGFSSARKAVKSANERIRRKYYRIDLYKKRNEKIVELYRIRVRSRKR